LRVEIETERRPPDLSVRYKRVGIRERVLRYMLGGVIQTAVVMPERGISRMILIGDDERGEEVNGNE